MFEFEAVDFPLNAYVSKSGQGSTASRNCRRNCRQGQWRSPHFDTVGAWEPH